MKERTIDRIPAELERWIADGNEVREDSTAPFAGLCGGVVKRNNGSENGGNWCQRAAGWATDHPGFGRCKFHVEQLDPDASDGALAPWVGQLTDDEWVALNGAYGAKPRHAASTIQTIRKSWEQWLMEALPPEEWHAYKTMPTDPLTLLDQSIKLNRLMIARIHRWLARQRMVETMQSTSVGGTSRSLEIQQAEGRLTQLDMVFARLMEVRARLSEAATGERAQNVWEDMLRGMGDDDFRRLSAKPDEMMKLLNRGATNVRGIGEPAAE